MLGASNTSFVETGGVGLMQATSKATMGVFRAAPTVLSAATTVPAQRNKADALDSDGSKKIVSLLATYDDDSEEEAAENSAVPKPGHPPEVLTSHWWEHWQDMLNPGLRHGLEVGKVPADLVTAWPRHIDAYPAGHPPAEPPGCCNASCYCMDGLRVQESDTRKPWVEEADGAADRLRAAQQAVEAFAKQPFVLERGRQSRQHLFQPQGHASQKAGENAAVGATHNGDASARRTLDALSRLAAAAVRDALDDVPAESFAGSGFRVPVAMLLPAESPYMPVRVEADATSPEGVMSVVDTQVRSSSSSALPSESSTQHLRMLFPEGKLVVSACRVTTTFGGASASKGQAFRRATSGLVEKIMALPEHYRPPFLQAFACIWDCDKHDCIEGVRLDEWLRAVERVFMLARAGATAHVQPRQPPTTLGPVVQSGPPGSSRPPHTSATIQSWLDFTIGVAQSGVPLGLPPCVLGFEPPLLGLSGPTASGNLLSQGLAAAPHGDIAGGTSMPSGTLLPNLISLPTITPLPDFQLEFNQCLPLAAAVPDFQGQAVPAETVPSIPPVGGGGTAALAASPPDLERRLGSPPGGQLPPRKAMPMAKPCGMDAGQLPPRKARPMPKPCGMDTGHELPLKAQPAMKPCMPPLPQPTAQNFEGMVEQPRGMLVQAEEPRSSQLNSTREAQEQHEVPCQLPLQPKGLSMKSTAPFSKGVMPKDHPQRR